MNVEQKNAIVISLNNNTSEIVQLADTLEYNVVKEFIQQRKIPDVNFERLSKRRFIKGESIHIGSSSLTIE